MVEDQPATAGTATHPDTPSPSSGAGGTAGDAASGGSALAGSSAQGQAGEAVVSGCHSDEDCPGQPGPCAYDSCDKGECRIVNVASGTLVERNVPADCHDTVCDGQGGEVEVLDLDNVPAAGHFCTLTSCSSAGLIETTFVETGGDCSSADGGKLCDGAGHCVACLTSADCQLGESCNEQLCVSSYCSDGFKDHGETDVDCGGACVPCGTLKDCEIDADCASGSCDAYAPHRCRTDHCGDHHKNSDESDDDCGGACAKCLTGFCNVDDDCVSHHCEKARGSICLSPGCVNGQLDGSETAVDCGGGICNGCALGESCGLFLDCASKKCDAATATCVVGP